jgi:hypothetical protein
MTRERWGWILVALAGVLLGAATRAPAMSGKMSARVQHQAAALAHAVRIPAHAN